MTRPRATLLPAAGEAGFTLLELLIAMTLLGLLSVVLFTGLRFGTQVWAKSETATADANKVRSFQTRLAEQISRIYPLFVVQDATNAHVQFDGTKASMRFLTPDPEGSGAMLQVRVETASGAGATTLMLKAHPELSIDQSDRTLAQLGGFQSLDFAYFGAEDANAAPGWHDSWQNMRQLPALIRIRAAFARGSHAMWPTLIVAPRISTDAACTISPLTKNCQGR